MPIASVCSGAPSGTPSWDTRLAGRPLKAPPEQVPPQTRVNIPDPDSRSVKAQQGFLQGYNAQAAATTSGQIIIAAEILGNANDYGMLESVTNAAIGELAAANVSEQIDVVLADAGYWDGDQIENLAARGMRPLVPPDSSTKKRNQGANRKGPSLRLHAPNHQKRHRTRPLQPTKTSDHNLYATPSVEPCAASCSGQVPWSMTVG
jgi:Transposase DDE domain